MYRAKEYIRLAIGVVIVVSIFICIGISSCAEKYKSFSEILNVHKNYSSELPNGFTTEVLDVNSVGGYDICVSDNQKIVGFSINKSNEECFNVLKSNLIDNNWNYVESDNKFSASFYKNDGCYTWLFLNCIKVGVISSAIFTFD